jgi:small subunit ribosomal protein S4
VTGENLLQLLEVASGLGRYRMGFGASRTEARQLVRHNGILVNGRRSISRLRQVRPGDVVEVTEKSRKANCASRRRSKRQRRRGFPSGSRSTPRPEGYLQGCARSVPNCRRHQ